MPDMDLMKKYLQEYLGDYFEKLSDNQIDNFCMYYKCLDEKSKVMNLTTILDEKNVAKLHFADSLFADRIDIIKSGDRIIDVGSGAGLPAVPIAIARQDVNITALDSTNKKTDFIEYASSECFLQNIDVICGRAEEVAKEKEFKFSFDVCVSRAVARLNVLLEICAGFVKMGGYILAFKGQKAQEEKDEAKRACSILGFKYVGEKKIDDDLDHVILIYKRIKSMPDTYPRKYSQIKKKPL